jgi:phosphoribosylanthranilate isomerase
MVMATQTPHHSQTNGSRTAQMQCAVKICGLTTEEDVEAAVLAGASFVGCVFFPPSPRHISAQQAAEILDGLPADITRVGLFVNPTLDMLFSVLSHVRLDMLQLHGAETPAALDAIRLETGLPVMKAIGVRTADDLNAAAAYFDVADWMLLDAKPPQDADRPGGHGACFDWSLLDRWRCPLPWMLAGGLTPENASEAATKSGAMALDVSSGVECAPGRKDPGLMQAFMDALIIPKL